MKVAVNETENAVVIRLKGEMMLGYEANEFHEAVRTSIEKNKNKVVVDLCELKFISSWGIGILIYGYTTAANNNCSFSLACVPQNVKDVFQKIKVDQIFKQYNTVEEALQA